MRIDEKIGQYLLKEADAKVKDKALKVIFSNYNGEIKRKGLRKLGYTDGEIKTIELRFAQAAKKAAKKYKVDFDDHKKFKTNFADIGGFAMTGYEKEIHSMIGVEIKSIL